MIETRAVLAARYFGRGQQELDARRHTHAYDTSRNVTLCGRMDGDSMADAHATDIHAQATCPTCARRDPRRKLHANDGPFILKSLIQF